MPKNDPAGYFNMMEGMRSSPDAGAPGSGGDPLAPDQGEMPPMAAEAPMEEAIVEDPMAVEAVEEITAEALAEALGTEMARAEAILAVLDQFPDLVDLTLDELVSRLDNVGLRGQVMSAALEWEAANDTGDVLAADVVAADQGDLPDIDDLPELSPATDEPILP